MNFIDRFEIKFEPEVRQDIQKGIEWYNEQQPGLSQEFYKAVKASLKKLQKHPFFQIRYDNVRCLPLKQYPYLIHFTVDGEEKCVIVRGVFNTSIDPDLWKKRM